MINKIIDDIYIGDWEDASRFNAEFIDIFTVSSDSPFKGNHFYPLVDCENSDNKEFLFKAIYDLISTREKSKGKILVHCTSGFSRSVAVIAGYMVIKYNYDVEDTLFYIKKIRPLANPIYELIELLKKERKIKIRI